MVVKKKKKKITKRRKSRRKKREEEISVVRKGGLVGGEKRRAQRNNPEWMENRANMINCIRSWIMLYIKVSFLPSDIENLKAEIQMLLEVGDPDLQVTFDYHNYTKNFNFYHGQISFKNNVYKEFNKDILLNDNDKKLFRKLIKINRNIVNIYKEWVQILEGKPDVGKYV